MAVVIFGTLTVINALYLWGRIVAGGLTVLDGIIVVLTVVFYILLVVAYLRRSRAEATDRDWRSWLVAFLGTGAPFLIPIVSTGQRESGAAATVAAAVLTIGLVFMLWALSYLGTNISVVPQAREVVTTGPYAWVRHPLYAAEIVNVVGVCLAARGLWPWAVLAGLIVLQYLRARREERLLASELVGYREYQARTPMLLPLPRRREAVVGADDAVA